MKWINFLHLYQPMNADSLAIKEATEKSYERIIRALEENQQTEFTLNISGCLLVRWDELGYKNIIERIHRLLKNGKIELTGTAMYHALLPLVPQEEIKYQIEENERILKKYFSDYKPRGFFLPEMAYDKEVAKIIKSFGYEWIILDEILYKGKLNLVDFEKIYLDNNSELKIIFRSRQLSKKYPPDELGKLSLRGAQRRGNLEIATPFTADRDDNRVFISATDAELYGLRHIDPTGEFEKVLKIKNLETQKITEYIDSRKKMEKILPLSGSWESEPRELKNKKPFAQWNENKIQKDLWNFTNYIYKEINKYKKDKNYPAVRWHLDRGLASCTYWWASGKSLGEFSPVAWNPDEVEKGINELIRAMRSIENKKIYKGKIKAEKLCAKIKEELWVRHWKNI